MKLREKIAEITKRIAPRSDIGDEAACEILKAVRDALPKQKDVMFSGLDFYKHQEVVSLDEVAEWGKKIGYNSAIEDMKEKLV